MRVGAQKEMRVLKQVLISKLLFDKHGICPGEQTVVTDDLIMSFPNIEVICWCTDLHHQAKIFASKK